MTPKETAIAKARTAKDFLVGMSANPAYWTKLITTQIPEFAEASPQRCLVAAAYTLIEELDLVATMTLTEREQQ